MKSLIRVLGAALLLWTTLCVAQQPATQESAAPDSLKGVQLKGKAPVNPNT
jgi:hypothetical protein